MEEKIDIKEQMIADTEGHIKLIEKEIKEADNKHAENTLLHHKSQEARNLKLKDLEGKLRRLEEGLIQVEEKPVNKRIID